MQPVPGVSLDVADLARWATERLAPYKRPAQIILNSDLPVGPTGKIFKVRLKQLAASTSRPS